MEQAEDSAPAGIALDPPEEVRVAPISPDRLREVLDPPDWDDFEKHLARAGEVFEGRVIWMVNSTAAGGGVAEMLRSFLAYARGAGVNIRWLVMSGTPHFFQITKRIHNFLHGSSGDGGELGEAERAEYDAVCAANAEHIAALVRDTDIVLLHDPQTAGMVPRLKQTGAHTVWRSHIGAERPNELVQAGWDFLDEYLPQADACVFSRHAYIPDWANAIRTQVIQPSIDVFSPKNQDLGLDESRAILAHVGLAIDGTEAAPVYTRYDGTPGRVDRRCEVLSTGPPPSFDDPLVVQISRWDRLKDHAGVMAGFAEHVAPQSDAHLILAGPTVHAVADDPESAEVLDEVVAVWRELPHARRTRVHLACLPMARHRGERGDRERAPAARHGGRPEEPPGGVRADRGRGDVEGPPGRGERGRRDPRPGGGRGHGRAARRPGGPRHVRGARARAPDRSGSRSCHRRARA